MRRAKSPVAESVLRLRINFRRARVCYCCGRQLPPEGTESIYAVTAVSVHDYPIKFGRQRLEQLSTSSPFPLDVVAASPAPAALERMIHVYLADKRLNGEWFHRSRGTLRVVSWLLAGRGEELLAELRSLKRRNNQLQSKSSRM